MGLTTTGLRFITNQIVAPGVSFNNVNSYIGVGNGTSAFAKGQTDLSGASKARRPMDTGYPIVTDETITFRATFPASAGNFTWSEWGVFNAATGGVMLVRKTESNGTKLNNQEWVITITIPLQTP